MYKCIIANLYKSEVLTVSLSNGAHPRNGWELKFLIRTLKTADKKKKSIKSLVCTPRLWGMRSVCQVCEIAALVTKL